MLSNLDDSFAEFYDIKNAEGKAESTLQQRINLKGHIMTKSDIKIKLKLVI